MHTHTSRGDGQAHRWARWDLGRWHRWTVANGRYADYRSHRMADGCCADGTARTMGLRRCEPRGAHLRSDQCLADCSTTFGTRWGRGDLMSWHAVRRGRVGQWQRCQAGAHWRTRGVPTAGCGPPAYLRTPVGCQLQLQRQRQCRQAGAPEEPRAPGARHPSSCASCARALHAARRASRRRCKAAKRL